MKTVYVLAKNVHGPCGHGEPGVEYLAIATDGDGWTVGKPLPVFETEVKAEEFKKDMRFGSWYKIVPLEVQ